MLLINQTTLLLQNRFCKLMKHTLVVNYKTQSIKQMKKYILVLACMLNMLSLFAQDNTVIDPIKADINGNGQIDIITAGTESLKLSIDKKQYSIPYELLGFDLLSELSFQNNILKIRGYNSGSGAYSWTYKFRYNKQTKKIELIGYDDFNKWVSGSVSTSINTITNQWEVKLDQYNHDTDKMETTKHTGKITLRKIALTDIKQEDISKLNAIGMKYWH
ncbi:MAG: hypothetical protein RL660_1732 [Bacteroidota bacterium]